MTLDQSALLELNEMMQSADGNELMRRLLGVIVQALVDAEATGFIGAERHERTEGRTTQRNGTRDKTVTTTAGDLTVKIPKVRTGSFFPALLAPRRRIDVALHAVVMQAYVEGVSTRRVDDLVVAMGGTGISKSEVSRICAKLDGEVAAWRSRPLDDQAFPYVFLDATYCKVRIGERVVSQAVVIATGVSADGRREVLGCAVGDSETESFWTEFLRDLRDRGLTGVQLVISDAHRGLINAINAVLQGSSWQRCRVHFMRNALAKVNKGHADMVATTIRTIFAQPGSAQVRAHVDLVADTLANDFPAVAELLRDAKADLRAFADFPQAHWHKIWSDEPARATEPGSETTLRRRRDLPQPRRPATPVSLRPDRSPRRMARPRPALPLRRIHGVAQPTRTHRPGTQTTDPNQDPTQGNRRYGIVDLNRRATRDELHHAEGRDRGRN
jgi:putative transposase